ncbi:hypothetical protein ACS0PU_007854, partial [Formica fusca]
TTDTEAGF